MCSVELVPQQVDTLRNSGTAFGRSIDTRAYFCFVGRSACQHCAPATLIPPSRLRCLLLAAVTLEPGPHTRASSPGRLGLVGDECLHLRQPAAAGSE